MYGRELALRNRVAVEQIRRKAGSQNDHDRAGDNLVHLETGRQGYMQQAHEPAHRQGDQDAKEKAEQQWPVVGRDLGHKTGKGAGQHHAFDADVDDARSFPQNAAECAEDQGNGSTQGEVEGADAK